MSEQIDILLDKNDAIENQYDDLRYQLTRYSSETRGAVMCRDGSGEIFTIAGDDIRNNDFLEDFVVDGVESDRCDPLLLLPVGKVMDFYDMELDPDLSVPTFEPIRISGLSAGD